LAAKQAIVRCEISHPDFPQKYKELFETTRKEFQKEVEQIPFVNKATARCLIYEKF